MENYNMKNYNMENYNLDFVTHEKLAESMTDGIADYKYFLWVPEWLKDAEEKEYLVLLNHGDSIDTEFEILYKFTAEYSRDKCHYAISKNGKTVIFGYKAKKGVICYDCEKNEILWNNPKVKKIVEVRFNNFDENIIEVLNEKLEITYLDKQTGQPLETEQMKMVRQVINWMRSSKNGKYLMTADILACKDKANYTVYNTETKEIEGRFVAQSKLSNKAFDITNDGKFAVCASYEKYGISLIEVATGNVLWTQIQAIKISEVYIDKMEKNIVISSQNKSVYILDIKTGEVEKRIHNDKMHLNLYGEDILFSDNKEAKIAEHSIKCPTFAWLDSLGIKGGVVLQPAAHEGVMLYDYNGNMVWENKDLYGFIAYQEDDEMICSYCSVDHIGKVTIISAKDGKTIAKIDIPEYAGAFISDNKILVCNTGKMYDVSRGEIKEFENEFEFKIC